MRKIFQPILAVVLGLALGLGVTALAGENPWRVFKILVHGAFGTRNDFGMTLFYSTPLIFTGLSVAIAFHAGLFNIGAEGQLTMGALAAAVGALWPGMPSMVAPVLAGLGAILAGMIWGAIPGWLRARRGSHEVINTIMFNFIAAGLASYVTLYLLKNPESQNPETRHQPCRIARASGHGIGKSGCSSSGSRSQRIPRRGTSGQIICCTHLIFSTARR